ASVVSDDHLWPLAARIAGGRFCQFYGESVAGTESQFGAQHRAGPAPDSIRTEVPAHCSASLRLIDTVTTMRSSDTCCSESGRSTCGMRLIWPGSISPTSIQALICEATS